jgi:hypothetical protein
MREKYLWRSAADCATFTELTTKTYCHDKESIQSIPSG